jgi:phage N-6-adenine-methyltransferase
MSVRTDGQRPVPSIIVGIAKYDEARRALAEAYALDEVKDVRDMAVAMEIYARQAKDTELSRYAAEIRLRAERRLGEMIDEKRAAGLLNTGAKGVGPIAGPLATRKPTLAEAGIDKHLADRARKAAAMPEAQWERKVSRQIGAAEAAASATGKASNPRMELTGEFEWYTPPEYIELARTVLGNIDLDPASSAQAQKTVRAGRYFTEGDDGLTREWRGRVWLNPPYSQPLISHFVKKLVDEVGAGNVTEAILLTHSYTDTKWFHASFAAASAVCFTSGRIKFIDPHGERASPTMGQAFHYFGKNITRFADVFEDIGSIAERSQSISADVIAKVAARVPDAERRPRAERLATVIKQLPRVAAEVDAAEQKRGPAEKAPGDGGSAKLSVDSGDGLDIPAFLRRSGQ